MNRARSRRAARRGPRRHDASCRSRRSRRSCAIALPASTHGVVGSCHSSPSACRLLLHLRPRLRPCLAPDRDHQRARASVAPDDCASIVRTTAPRWLFDTHASAADRAAARRDRHRRRPDRQPASRRARDHRPGARISTSASPSSSRGRRRCCERTMRALVVADAPPLACAAADDAGIPVGRLRELHLGLDLSRVPRAARRRRARRGHRRQLRPRVRVRGGCRSTAASRPSGHIVDIPLVARRGRARRRPALVTDAARAAGGAAARAGLLRRLRPAPASARPSRLPARLGRRRVVARRRSRRRCRRGVHNVREDAMYDARPALRGPRRRRGRRHHQAGIRHHLGLRGQRHGDALHVARAVSRNTRSWSARCRGSCAAGASSPRRSQTARWNEGLRELAALPPPPEQPRDRWRRSRGGDDRRPGQCALTVVTSDQIRGKFTFSIDIGLRSAWARNAGRSRSDLNPM